MLPLAAGAAVTLASLANSALGQTAVWVGNGTSPLNFNASPPAGLTYWRDVLGNPTGTPPLGTMAAPTNLIMSQGNSGALTVTQNVGTPWVLNSLNFNVNNAFTLQGTAGNVFQFVSPSPVINMNGVGTATLSATGAGPQLADNLTIGGTGAGNMTLNAVTETGGSHSVTITAGNPRRDMRIVFFGAGVNGYTGGLILDGGSVGVASGTGTVFGAVSGTFTVTSNGGTVANTASANLGLATILLNGDLHVIGSGGLTLGTTTAPISTVALQGGPNVTLYNQTAAQTITLKDNSGSGAASPFTGAVVVDLSELPQMATTAAGTISLDGNGGATPTSGSLNMASSFDIRAGGTLLLNNNVIDSVQNGDRIGDNTPVRLRSGKLFLSAPAAAVAPPTGHGYNPTSLTEQIGDLSGAGNSTVTVSVTIGSGGTTRTDITTLMANRLLRQERGTFNFRGPSYQNAPAGTNGSILGDGVTPFRGRIMLTDHSAVDAALVGGGGMAGSQNISILPYAEGDISTSGPGFSLITYGADGFRLLQPPEFYTTDLAPGDPTANVQVIGAATNNASTTMNSLVLGNGTTDGSISGSGTLNVTSGVVLTTAVNATAGINIANNIAFGSAEGIIYTPGFTGTNISGQLTGTNGLTRSSDNSSGAENVLVLSADNSGLTGPLTLDAGKIQYNSAVALPGRNDLANIANSDPIVANGSIISTGGNATGLFYANAAPMTINRPIAVNTGMMTFRLTNARATTQSNIGSLTIAGPITGAGGVNYQAQTASSSVTTPGDIYVTNTGNTYSGVTQFGSGNVHVYGEGSVGTGAWNFAGGTMILEGGNKSNSREINFSATSTIDTHGFDMTLNGPISGYLTGGLSTATTAGLNKNGAGTLTLTNAANTLAGVVTVNGGTLLVDGNLGPSATNGLTVNNGATLGGSGIINRNVTIAAGGTLSPGNSPGILTIQGSLNMAPASGTPATLSMQLNGPTAGTGYDQVVSILQNGASVATVQLGVAVPANLSLSLGYAPSASDVFWLIRSTNTLGVTNQTTGAFAGLPEGATVTLGTFGVHTFSAQITYNGNYETGQLDHSGNDVALYNVTHNQVCGSADFNCDGGVGTDADIEAFFACLSGSCPPPPCTSTADFNDDGSVGTDADIEAFFRVLAGGPC
jgi:autotransporter-associated beta strand protein